MSFWKLSLFLVLGIFILHQAGMLQAAPFRSSPEGNPPAAVNEEEGDLLLPVVVRQLMRKVANKRVRLVQSSSASTQKRTCNTGTCLTQRLAGLLSRSGSVAHTNLLPPDMTAKHSRRKGRDLDA